MQSAEAQTLLLSMAQAWHQMAVDAEALERVMGDACGPDHGSA
jgi:hypothetical protein